MTLATRKFYSSILVAAVTLAQFLASFIILGISISSAIVGPSFLTPAAYADCNLFYAQNLPCPKRQLTDFKTSIILAAISIAFLFIGYVLCVLSNAIYESEAQKEAYNKGGRPGTDLVGGSGLFWGGLVCVYLGVVIVLAAVSLAVAGTVTRNDWAFIVVVCVFGVVSIISGIGLFITLLKYREQPTQYATQPAFIQQGGGNI
eukprot:TRINITY_DN953_c0_g1_i1.p1 TRINITY_DN953_c0_g1~~TRINITY_DN953_c0_g1_i1.p1  ORF type:complete len:203 (+),score=56.23 TRINITY_DN953_c0_g1_i1:134-742(+)